MVSDYLQNSFALFSMPGGGEWIVILIVILIFVGPRKLPELMRAIGKSVNAFKEGMKDGADESKDPSKKNPQPPL